jgi:hypothetical protein
MCDGNNRLKAYGMGMVSMTRNGEGELLPLFGEDPPTLLCPSRRQQIAFARARKPSKLSSLGKIGAFIPQAGFISVLCR